jgi:hypothetical protein
MIELRSDLFPTVVHAHKRSGAGRKQVPEALILEQTHDGGRKFLRCIADQQRFTVYDVESLATDGRAHDRPSHRHRLKDLHARSSADAQRNNKDFGAPKVRTHILNITRYCDM